MVACVLFIVIVLDDILPSEDARRKSREGEREKPNFSIGCSTLQSINNRTPFFLIIVTIVIYAAVQYCSGDLVFVCGRMCVCMCARIYTRTNAKANG